MTKYRPVGVALAFFFVVLFLGALGLRIWASGRAAETVGPIHITASQHRVYVSMEGRILVLSGQGDLLEQERISRLAPTGTVSDLRMLPDGRLLLAMQQTAGIFLCDVDPWSCAAVASGVDQIHAELKVLPDPGDGGLFVTDFAGGELWKIPVTGGKPEAMVLSETLSGPNDIAADTNGHLWIADSGHYRIVELERNTDTSWGSGGAWKVLRAISARNPLTRHGRDWPTMLVQGADGNWWVTQADGLLNHADLYVLSPGDQQPWSRIDLPAGAHPTDLAPVGDAILVTDVDRFHIYRVDTTTHEVDEFGDASLLAWMRDAHGRKAHYRALAGQSWFGMIGAGALMLLAAFWATPKDKRLAPAPKGGFLVAGDTPMPELQEIHWLQRNAKTERFLRWMKPLVYSAFLLLFVSLGWFYLMAAPHHGGSSVPSLAKTPVEKKELETALLLVVYILASLPILMHFQVRTFGNRVGTDGQRLFVRLFDGHQISMEPERVVYTTRLIAWQDQVFPVRAGNGKPLYADGELETYIAPLLSRAKKLTPWGMSLYLIQNREPGTMASWILVAILVVALTVTGSWPYVWRILLHRHQY